MHTLLKRIQLAIGTGAALCASTTACSDSVSKTDAGHDASDNDAGAYALSELGCFGPVHDGGYYGQCCVEALCYTPNNGGCMAANDPMIGSTLPGFPPGSGSCSCSEVGEAAVRGPFAPNPNDPSEVEGTCCYLVGSISCEGRPLCIEGMQVVAAAVVRDDWMLA